MSTQLYKTFTKKNHKTVQKVYTAFLIYKSLQNSTKLYKTLQKYKTLHNYIFTIKLVNTLQKTHKTVTNNVHNYTHFSKLYKNIHNSTTIYKIIPNKYTNYSKCKPLHKYKTFTK